jgi:exosortase
LLAVCYLPVLQRLVNQWSTDEDMGHGLFVPAIAAYIVWQNRAKIAAMPWKTTPAGLALILFSGLQLMIGTLGAELFLRRTAIIECITGIVLFVGGWAVLKELAFPLALLVFMVPLPAVIYNQITFPLQLFASAVAEAVLGLIGIPVLREGNVLERASQKLSVVEACSGIRSFS